LYSITTVRCRLLKKSLHILRVESGRELNRLLNLIPLVNGCISRQQYAIFLGLKFVVNIHDVVKPYRIEDIPWTGSLKGSLPPDINREITDAVVKVNPALDPGSVKINIAKDRLEIAELSDSDLILNKNPFWKMEKESGSKERSQNRTDLIEDFYRKSILNLKRPLKRIQWGRINRIVSVRQFLKSDGKILFINFLSRWGGGKIPGISLSQYQLYIVLESIPNHRNIFREIDRLAISPIITVKELYELSIQVNPFLAFDKANFKLTAQFDSLKQLKTLRHKVPGFDSLPKERIINLEKRLNSRIIGQKEAVSVIVETIRVAAVGLRHRNKPVGTFFFAGRTGTGKTHTAKVLAEELFGSQGALVQINCSEFSQEHEILKLTGAPASYIGYDNGGFLTNEVKRKPLSVVLFDEIEKAGPKLFNLLLQIMDEGVLVDNKGNRVSFKDCILILTSNIGVREEIKRLNPVGFISKSDPDEAKKEAVREALKKTFQPEFINRLDQVITFRSLRKEDCSRIVNFYLNEIRELLSEKRIRFQWDNGVQRLLSERGFSPEFGARHLERVVHTSIVVPLSKQILESDMESVYVGERNGELIFENFNSNKSTGEEFQCLTAF